MMTFRHLGAQGLCFCIRHLGAQSLCYMLYAIWLEC